jgi:hypothetical protein
MKTKFKLTPQAHKDILEAVKTLPALVKLNANGKPQYRKLTTFKGYNMKTFTKQTQHELQPVYVNHEIELISAYKIYGEKAITEYTKFVNEVNDKTKK